ncbi:methionyl-tRNA formyltransferase [Frankia casuarinae]|uniref:Methionyl-tRNA formyltransferase n=1 Tax=Frankia casuarinae (strain DSM 45818 / CECT 9043 / HFP020203 / CcI3) TaxID=106370 RepID=FMT_FRACC|nr:MULTISPECIES: methionyl-tRNA formyltransferase [Frankia]Q2J845.1 RecName: Full=Methionyl-tRNA formyltransferase [Frankia casuarinae]ABD12547.1 methionyl-tRNA formyltransferase [Frankia casuarinae]ETA01070.1 methionyl-tRNA formyltransferase [Frankia sp. CcI6]EYT90939.1 methionyl-tRNA formyltransferase [Frankia casuarinae]KDA42126.1 methionyl-tRNA formyltransferase [Frankia sp. BMG5.23]KFB03663.1 methionyl-tRNA formyltransferase [Frankia sp. Allo2]
MRLVFAGTPAVALPSLRALIDSPRHDVVAVVTRPDRPSGRGRKVKPPPVHVLADEAGIPVLSPDRPRDPEFLATLAGLAPDCCPVVAYGALLPPAALAIPRHGWVNLHFSLLPAYRGAAPVQRTLLAGDDLTGASVFQIEPAMDSGPVYGVLTERVRPTDTSGDLLDRLAEAGAGLLVAVMDGIADGTVRPVAQPAEGISFAPKLTAEEARIDWTKPAIAVDRLARAATPAPGAWTTFRDRRLKIGPVRLGAVSGRPAGPVALPAGLPAGGLPAGQIMVLPGGDVAVGTGTSPVLLGEVRPEGRGPMAAAAWARGVRIAKGETLGAIGAMPVSGGTS